MPYRVPTGPPRRQPPRAPHGALGPTPPPGGGALHRAGSGETRHQRLERALAGGMSNQEMLRHYGFSGASKITHMKAALKAPPPTRQQRLGLKLIAAYQHGDSGGGVASALDKVGRAYLNNPIARNPIVGRKGLMGAGEDLLKSVDPITLGQTLAKRAEHPLRFDRTGINAGVVFGGPGGARLGGAGEGVRGLEHGPADVVRPRTRIEAEARLAHLDKQNASFEAKLMGRFKSIDPQEQLARSKTSGLQKKGGKEKIAGSAKAMRHGTVSRVPLSDQFIHSEIQKVVAKHPEHPAVKNYLANHEEAARLREALAPSLPGEAPKTEFGTVRVPAPPRVAPSKVADVPNIPGVERTPAEVNELARKSLSPGRRLRGEQEKLRKAERASRRAKGEEAFQKAGGGLAGVKAAQAAQRGEFPKVMFENFRNLNQKDYETLISHVSEHPDLTWYEQKFTAPGALRRAREEGRIPAKHEDAVLRKAFGNAAADALKKPSLMHKIGSNALGLWNLPRALRASVDISWPGRQGLGVLASSPKDWAATFGPQFKALPGKRGEAYYHAKAAELMADPEVQLLHEHGLKLQELGQGAVHRPEAFLSKFSEDIPGVRASARSYTIASDVAMARLGKTLLRRAERRGVNIEDPREVRDIVKLVNVFAGRGGGARLQKAAPVIGPFIFAPQLVAARLQMLNPAWGRFLTPFARHELNMARLRLGLGAGAVLGGAAAAGVTVGHDPRSADFAKIRVGDTRFDILGGHQQYLRTLAQVGPKALGGGKVISSTTGKTLTLRPGFGNLTRGDILGRFAASKLAPSASYVNQALGGVIGGHPYPAFDPKSGIPIPLAIQDALDLAHQKGAVSSKIAKGVGGYGISAVGIGTQTYGGKTPGLTPAQIKDLRKQQNVHLTNLVRKGILTRKDAPRLRRDLDIYNKRNSLYKAIDDTTGTGKLNEKQKRARERQKTDALLTLLQQNKRMAPTAVKHWRGYLTAHPHLTSKELSTGREWFWREAGLGGSNGPIAWYRNKAGATD